jgi:glycosyltransferase involved in cell wall biosynthesis
MNILYIDHTILRCGACISLSTLIRYLPSEVRAFFMLRPRSEVPNVLGVAPERMFSRRFMVEFMTTVYTPPYPPWLFLWHLLKIPIAFFRLGRLKRRWTLDLVHVNESVLLIYVFAARLVGLPVVLHARTVWAKRPFERFLLWRISHLKAVRIIAIDGEVKASLPKRARRITQVVYNPIELGAEPSPEETVILRRSWGFSRDHVVIGQIAFLYSQKGIWLILDLAEELCAEFPFLRFVLVGDDSPKGGEGPQLRHAIRQRALSGRVVLPGYYSHLASIYAALDIALCLYGASLGGVGRGAYEAAIAGKPLIATLPDPSASETLVDGVTAKLFRPDDKAGILRALRHLAGNAEAREKLGATAKAAIGNRHAPKRISRAIFDVYEELVGSARNP